MKGLENHLKVLGWGLKGAIATFKSHIYALETNLAGWVRVKARRQGDQVGECWNEEKDNVNEESYIFEILMCWNQ